MTKEDTLIATVGLPRAGKTTWINKLQDQHGWPVVEVDAVRDAVHGSHYNRQAEPLVWMHTRVMIRALFRGHHDVVILDSTMISSKRRNKFDDENFQVAFKEFHTSVETCIDRAKMSDQEFLIPVIKRMDKNREPLPVDGLHFEDWYELWTENHDQPYQELLDNLAQENYSDLTISSEA